MKMNWKTLVLYLVRLVELMLTGAAGGAIVNNLTGI